MEATNVPEVFDSENLKDSDSERKCKKYENSELRIQKCSQLANNHTEKRNNESSLENANDKSYPKNDSDELSNNNLQLKISEEQEKDITKNDQQAEGASGEEVSCTAAAEKPGESSAPHSPAPLAFVIDFGSNKEVDTARYQNLFQRYNARHRRNLSTSKIEIKAKKPPVVSSPSCVQKQKAPSTHSEGYFSSEDDTKRKADQLSQKLKELGLKTNTKSQGATRKSDVMSKSYTERSYKDAAARCYDDQLENIHACRENLSLELDCRARPGSSSFNHLQHSATMNDLSGVQKSSFDDERSNRVQYSPEKKYTKNIEYIEINHDYEPDEFFETTCESSTEKLSNVNYVLDNGKSNEFVYSEINESKMQMSSASFTAETSTDGVNKMNLDIFNVSNADAGSDGTVSEAGTYTIHKDYTNEEKARMDIDKAFSVGVLTEQESDQAYVHHFKMTSSRDTNTWISEWATQVAEHNSLPPQVGGSTGRTPPMSPSKIPSPIYSRSQRLSRRGYEQSDSSLDMETHLHIKERICSGPNQHTLIDSGGESDEDTSNSYVTPPHSSQRTPTHGASVVRRGSLSESLFKRSNANEGRRSVRKYVDNKINKMEETMLKSPSHVLACLHLERSSSLDRKEYMSDTADSNSSRKSSLKNYVEDNLKHTNSPILNRLRPSTPKLTNSPILAHKELATKVINSPILDKAKHVMKSTVQTKNIGYFTCSESSPYMLRKSNSTNNYHEDASVRSRKELTSNISSVYHNSPVFQRNVNIQRSSSNASIRNAKLKSVLTRRSSFNNNDIDRISSTKGKFTGSDSSSETGEQQPAAVAPPISSSIKLNRAFSTRRGRLSCESDSTPNTTPEERRRKAQTEIKSAPCSARQPSHHRGRTSSVGASSKEVFKKPEPPKPRAPSISRTDTGRFSMRTPKTSHTASSTRPNAKTSKDHKKSTRSNSTLTSKEVEFQNWKRRKSYDPMKAAAEGKKRIDGPKKHHSIENGSSSRDNSVLRSASFHGTRGTLSLADDWSDNEVEFTQKDIQAPPPCSPQLGSDSDLETSSYLQTTHNVMSAMSARMNVYNPALVDSGGESDEDTSHSFRQGTSKTAREMSDTESSDDPHAVTQSPITNTKYNRAFSLRRGRLEPQETKTSSVTMTKPKPCLPAASVKGKSDVVPSISRTDSGRFSMRLPKTSANTSKLKPKETKKPLAPNTREVEMQNWKRRKSYDPMKAAMEGKKKAGLAKRNIDTNSSSSHVSRSQSFHGPATLGISEWSDEDVSASADEAPIY